MKGAMLYINAGKGHYTPAKALSDSFVRAGHEAILEDLFVVFDTPFWEVFCKYDWRFLLHHPKMEPYSHSITDNRLSYYLIKKQGLMKRHYEGFVNWYEKNKPDFIISTNFLGGVFLPAVVKKAGINIPIYQYAADVFDTPITGINSAITKMYFPSSIGCENAIKKGQAPETVAVCPFPLQENLENYKPLEKEEARKKLGLENRFTVLFSLGGEGIGNLDFLFILAKKNLDLQVVVVGGKSKTTNRAFERFEKEYPDFKLYRKGFVNNINEYLSACDIQIGKAGANSVMESVYLKRPCIVSEVLYAFKASKTFFSKYGVGWDVNKPEKQAEIIEKCCANPEFMPEMEKRFSAVDIEFSSDRFRDLLIKDTNSFYNK